MKAMTAEEAQEWCLKVGPRVNKDNLLGYIGSERRFFVSAPDGFHQIIPFTRAMLTFRGEVNFSGGLLWTRRSDLGSPQLNRVGRQIVEAIRRAHGDTRPLEVAPAQLFRDDELVDLHAFLVQVVGFGWTAEFVPSTGGFFLRFKDNRQVCFAAESEDTLRELRISFSRWNPTDEDPMVKRLAKLKQSSNRRKGQT